MSAAKSGKALSGTFLCALLFLGAALETAGACAADEAESLTPYLPSGANGLCIVRVQEILASPRARKEDWARNTGQFLAGADTVPAWANTLVMGMMVHPGRSTDNWSAAVLRLPGEFSMEALAKAEAAPLQSIAGAPALHVARNAYYLQLAPHLLGVISPAMRQDAARWIRYAQGSERRLESKYLTEASQSSDHIILALDTLDMLDPQLVRNRLAVTESLKGDEGAVAALTPLISGLRGIKLTANVRDRTSAQIELDFARAPSQKADLLKAVFLEVLEHEESVVNDLAASTAALEGDTLVLSTELSDAGLRQILSLVLAPFPSHSAAEVAVRSPQATSTPPTAEDQAQEKQSRNRKYYKAVSRVLQDLQQTSGFTTANHAAWIERYAQKISNLPINGLDEEMVQYGGSVASKLNALAASLRGMEVKITAQQGALTYNMSFGLGGYGGYGWGGYGRRGAAPYWNVNSNLSKVREKQAAAVTKGSDEREKIWQSIQQEKEQIRDLMNKRYGVDFEQGVF